MCINISFVLNPLFYFKRILSLFVLLFFNVSLYCTVQLQFIGVIMLTNVQSCKYTCTHTPTISELYFFSKPKRTHFPLCSHSLTLINRFIVKASLLDTICLISDHPRLQHEEKMTSNIILAQRYHCVSRTHLWLLIYKIWFPCLANCIHKLILKHTVQYSN